jgi:hypothetical protein
MDDTHPIRTRKGGATARQPDLADTQPRKTTPPPPHKPRKSRRRFLWRILLTIALFALLMGLATLGGAISGYRSGTRISQSAATLALGSNLEEQYRLALQDIEDGRYEVAQQRLQYILEHNPSFPGAAERLAEAMAVLYATATPTPPPPTETPTPTQDLRPVEEMFAQAQTAFTSQKWDEVIDTLLALRKSDPAYQTARLDGMLFMSLRQRGVDKIWKEGNLEAGTYDLALAGRFAPLDLQANTARDMARLYMVGVSFWEVYPEQAIIYLSQVAAAAPGLRDAGGWTAAARYREVLIQYGDQLVAKKDWCNAQQQYELALSMGADAALEGKVQEVTLLCSPPSATPAPTSGTPSVTPTLPPNITPSATAAFPTFTNTPLPPTNTSGPPSETPTLPPPPSETPTLPPPASETPTQTPEPSATPTTG